MLLGLIMGVLSVVFLEMINHETNIINDDNIKSVLSAKLLMANSMAFKTLMTPFSWLISVFMASMVASIVQNENAQKYAVSFAVLFATIAIINMFFVNSPKWMWLMVLVLIYPVSYFGSRFPIQSQKSI